MAAEHARQALRPDLGLLALSVMAVVGLAGLVSGSVGAQTAAPAPAAAPATRDMIEALKPGRQRNLVVRQTAPAPGPDAPQANATPALAPAAASAPPLSPVPAAPPGTEPPPSLSLAIQFDLNSARVRPESGEVLGHLVAAMMSPDLKSNRFVIEGHTDARGSVAINRMLSQQRAEEVRLFLVTLGVHPARLKAVGKGSSEPADPGNPLSADNRRVRVVTLE